MSFTRRTAQLLHEDHQATLAMITRLEALLALSRGQAPDLDSGETAKTLEQTAAAIENEVRHHFAFEEEEVFTRLTEAGEGEIALHLTEEHRAILPAGERLAALARAALQEGFDDGSWRRFREQAADFTERLLVHVEKEEMALLPVLDDLLEPETDFALAESYGLRR